MASVNGTLTPLTKILWAQINKHFDFASVVGALFRCETRGKTTTLEHASVHLISKALPQRCQIRNLKEIVKQYVIDFPNLGPILRSIVFLGISHSEYSYKDIRHEMIRTNMFEQLDTRALFETQFVIFTFLKFFVIAAVYNIPALHNHVSRRCHWDQFAEEICDCVRYLNFELLMNYREHGAHGMFNQVSTSLVRKKGLIRNVLMPQMSQVITLVTQWKIKRMKDIHFQQQTLVYLESSDLPALKSVIGVPRVESDFSIRSLFLKYIEHGNKLQLLSGLDGLSLSTAAYLAAIVSKHTEYTNIVVRSPCSLDESLLSLFVCRTCYDVKNSKQTYTSLRSVMYEPSCGNMFCIKKRLGHCTKLPLRSVAMGNDTIVILESTLIYFICQCCKCLSHGLITRGSTICDSCRDVSL